MTAIPDQVASTSICRVVTKTVTSPSTSACRQARTLEEERIISVPSYMLEVPQVPLPGLTGVKLHSPVTRFV